LPGIGRLSVPGRTRGRRAGFVALVLVVVAAVAVGLVVLVRPDSSRPPIALQPSGTPAATASAPAGVEPALAQPGPVLPAQTGAGRAVPAATVSGALAKPLADKRLGSRVSALVLDLSTGANLYARDPARLATPASTAKLTTAAALLASYPADHRLTTRVVAGGHPGEVVLVGGGDPTLSAAPRGQPTVYPGAARLADLAAAIGRSGVRPTKVLVDASLFAGPGLGQHWDPSDVAGGYITPVTAVMVDAGRQPGKAGRSATPDLDAGRQLAALLRLPPTAVSRGSAPAGARELASAQSPPLGRMLDDTLLNSDNVLAEVLLRQVAIAQHKPASFAGAVAAVKQVMSGLGLNPAGDGLEDGSGLSPKDKLSPALLAGLLRAAASDQHPELHPLFAGLPVGGYDGTLDTRYRAGPAAAGAGAVRAKTGTLTGVSTLAGVVQTAGGRLLVFAFLADAVPSPHDAEAALDVAVTALTRLR
jgi:D-alanyl-D-alanine carboxypeptidase